jgi:hypothetical protein
MRTRLATSALLLALLFLAACGDDEDTTAPTATAAPTITNLIIDVCGMNPDPATPDVNEVTFPAPGDVITSPVQITGQISAFEATFQITIYDAQGNELADQFAMSNEGQTLAPFSATVPFTATVDTPACIWVYEISPADGAPIHVVQIPVLLQP